MRSMMIWYLERPGKVVRRPVAITSTPSCGWKARAAPEPFHITPSMTALSSFRHRYEWPEATRLKPEISPRRRTEPNSPSTIRLSA